MLYLPNAVFGRGIDPVDTNGTTTNGPSFDLAALGGGFREVACIVSIGNIAANATTLKIQESNDNSTWTDVTGGGFTAPTAAAGDNTIRVAVVTTGGARNRYVRVTATGGAGATVISAVWVGLGATQSPNSATERNVSEYLFVGN